MCQELETYYLCPLHLTYQDGAFMFTLSKKNQNTTDLSHINSIINITTSKGRIYFETVELVSV